MSIHPPMKDPIASNQCSRNRSQTNGSRRWPAIFVALSLFGWSLQGSCAGEFDSALGALQQLDYAGAATILTYLADAGDPRAQAALAILIESGTEIPDYPVPALELLREAANHGLPEAALELGNRSYLGAGTPRDLAQAVDWWRIAAEKGSTPAAFNLGLAYAKGSGTTIDADNAQHWFEQAANSGFVQARFALGVVQLESGKYRPACTSFKQAATADLPSAQYNLGSMLERGIGCELDLEQAILWYRRAAAANVAIAKDALKRLNASPSTDVADPAQGIYPSQWVLRQKADHYTLQVATGGSESAIVKILNHYSVALDRAWFKLNQDGRVRYLALVGSFSTRLEANAYLDKLEPELKVNNPWVRRFESIQGLADD